MDATKKKILKKKLMSLLPEWIQDEYVQGYLKENIKTFEERKRENVPNGTPVSSS